MKSRFIIICLFLLLLTVTAVSAQDNITDESTCDADNSSSIDKLSQDSQEDILQDDPLNVHLTTDNYTEGESIKVVYRITSDKPTATIDGIEKNIETVDEDDDIDTVFFVSTKGLSLGSHVLNVKFTNKNSQVYVDKNFTFNVKYVMSYVPENIYIGELNEWMYVNFASDATGSLKIMMDGSKVIYNGDANFIYEDLSNLEFGVHKISIDYSQGNYDEYHRTYTVNATYRFNAKNYTTIYGYERDFYSFWGPYNLDMKKLVAKIDGVTYDVSSDGDDYYTIDTTGLGIGVHNLKISYSGDSRVPGLSANVTITVEPYFSYLPDFIYSGETLEISSKLPKDAKSTLEVYLDGNLYNSKKFANGAASIPVNIIKLGDYLLGVKITGDYAFEFNRTLSVDVYMDNPIPIYAGEENSYVFKLPNAKGNISADFDGIVIVKPFVNGVATVPVPTTLKVGWYSVNFTYDDGTNKFNITDSFFVDPKFKVPSRVIDGVGEVSLTLPYKDNVGKLILEISDGKNEYVVSKNLVDGKATISLSNLTSGSYSIVPIYFDGVEEFKNGAYDVIVRNSNLTAKNLKMYYSSASSFKVKVVNYNGKIVKNGKVKFYINNKFVKTVKTNAKGYAILKIGKAPGIYNITAKYGNIKLTRKLTVLHVVSLKSVNVKKSAKKLVLKATLKKGKKPIRYKKVTFKFNGKTYTAKTNKKGVAKLTIKKSVLKKLKVGKKVTYQAKYLKDTVKKVAIVKK